ncbi:GrpB family protein [Metabacillus litoralis]|uniref:GrpB family protein n=1 Tax=Metabacillus litoralis TaxID=152268 RepID=A0A5C6W2P5_9BACI|nr:GrpB family protein [Metabacillus litoralis]TXC92153.1 GrpB family protein [Metabacillus litoralis]
MKVNLSEYDPNWTLTFQKEEKKLHSILNDLDHVIEHIGSTSIEGLSAKPIIDIMIGLKDETLLDIAAEKLAVKPYIYVSTYNKEIPFRRFFIGVKNTSIKNYPTIMTEDNIVEVQHENRKSHIHVVPLHSNWWNDHILFRDYLRVSRTERLQYEQLKKELSVRNWNNGNEYASAKSDCIMEILERARSDK